MCLGTTHTLWEASLACLLHCLRLADIPFIIDRDPRNVGKAGSIAFMLSYNYPVEETFEMATLTQVRV